MSYKINYWKVMSIILFICILITTSAIIYRENYNPLYDFSEVKDYGKISKAELDSFYEVEGSKNPFLVCKKGKEECLIFVKLKE